MFKIFLTNLRKYVEGELVGVWVDLPVYDDFEEAFKEIGIDEEHEEWFITDYENDFGIDLGEYDSIYEVNELAETAEDLDDYDKEIIEVLCSEGYDFEEALNLKDDVIVYRDCLDMGDVAREYCDSCGILSDVPEHLQNYFDYDAFGRDMSYEGTFIYKDGNYYEVIH